MCLNKVISLSLSLSFHCHYLSRNIFFHKNNEMVNFNMFTILSDELNSRQ